MQGLLFSYDGSVDAQTIRLFAAMERLGWRAGMSPSREDCEGRCILGQITLVFVRLLLRGESVWSCTERFTRATRSFA